MKKYYLLINIFIIYFFNFIFIFKNDYIKLFTNYLLISNIIYIFSYLIKLFMILPKILLHNFYHI